ncbi:MAG: glycosyltransferase family 39 protein [Thermoproteota archaeon]
MRIDTALQWSINMLQIQSRIQSSGHWLVFAVVIILGLSIASYLYSLDKYSLVYFGDSVSHMLGARKLVDWSENPGFAQLGTVWLPLPHIILLPFTLIDPLFTTGFAGVIVSLPCLAITTALLYKMIRIHLVSGFSHVAFIGALLYALNPNILYLGMTAMTEAPFMLFFVASAYFLQKWHRNPEQLRILMLSSIFVVLATLCRYEGWILPLFLAPFATMLMIKGEFKVQKKMLGILLALASFLGIAFWVSYNAIQYGDPLEFANAEYYSASSQALNRDIRQTLFLQPANVLSIYGITAYTMYGPILLSSALLGYVVHRRKEGSKNRRILYVFLALPPLFTIITLLIGIGEMNLWFNSRFLILLLPLLIMLAVLLLQNLPNKIKNNRGFVITIIGALFVFQISMIAFNTVPTYLDARGGFLYKVNPFAIQTGESLNSMYDDGMIMIMTGSAQGHRIMVTGGIPLKQYDEIIESSTWKESFYEPWLYDKWIILSKVPDSDGANVVKYWQDRRSELDEHYKKVYENEYHEILVLK